MADQRLSRRQMVKGAGALGAASALVALQGSTAAHADTTQASIDSIVGSWLINSRPDGDRLLYSFIPGGVLIKTRAGSTVFTRKHLNTNGALHGARVRTGARTLSTTTYELRTDGNGTFIGSATVQDIITLDQHQDTFSAHWTFEWISPDGSVGPTFSGTLHGTRIKVKKP